MSSSSCKTLFEGRNLSSTITEEIFVRRHKLPFVLSHAPLVHHERRRRRRAGGWRRISNDVSLGVNNYPWLCHLGAISEEWWEITVLRSLSGSNFALLFS